MSKEDNIRDFLADLYQGIATKKPNASKNPQNFRAEVESIAGAAKLQEKTATPSLESQRIVADDGNDGLSAVNIEAIQTVEGLANGSGVFYPATGKLYSKFTVNIPADDSGECSGEHIISVTELPTDNIRSDVMYKRVIDKPFQGVIMIDNEEDGPYDICATVPDGYTFEFYTVDTKPSDEDVIKTDYMNDSYCLYLVKDENDIFMYMDANEYFSEGWMTIGELFSYVDGQLSFGGVISDMEDAVSIDKYYALGGGTVTAYYQYIDGAWSEYIVPNGTLTISRFGEHDVTLYSTVDVKNMGPGIYVGKTANDLPTDVADGSYGVVTHGDSNLSGVTIPIHIDTPWLTYLNSGRYVWYEGDNVYYSEGAAKQYVLDKETFKWRTKEWNADFAPNGQYIWTDGTNTYYSYGSYQYVLNKETSTWEPKTWNGLTSFSATVIWTDGANIYYSSGSSQYVLNKETSTWEVKTWSGMPSFNGEYVWTDGTNIYYSYTYYTSTNDQYILDKETSTWMIKQWAGNPKISGVNIWTDGINVYHDLTHVLDGDTWKTKIWDKGTLYAFYAHDVWTDGTNYYCSYHLNDSYPGQVLLAPSASLHVFANGRWYKASNVGEPALAEKTITDNGIYRASNDNVQGYTNVTVRMPAVYKAGSLNDVPSDAVEGSIAMIWEVN